MRAMYCGLRGGLGLDVEGESDNDGCGDNEASRLR